MEFWQQVTKRKYPELKKTNARLLSVFSPTYCCESLFSVMKFIKSKYRASLTNEHLSELISTALSSYRPDFRSYLTEWKPTVDQMLAKSCKNCDIVYCCVCFYEIVLSKACCVYCVCINTSNGTCGSAVVLHFRTWLF